MKQKVGLCGALIHDPDLLILDEPTTGVDPLSRQQFWNLIDHIREQRPGMSVLVSTAYMDEAQRFDWTIAMDAGRVIATGTPAQLMERTGTKNLEEAFVSLLPGAQEGGAKPWSIPPRVDPGGEPAIQATDLTKRFGSFTAVNRVSFTIGRGEIFGFLGSNGCGKSTTMKMLTGLLPATEGEAKLFGEPVDADDLATRKRVGYMSQAFSLYGELSVRQNLDLHAKIFDLPRDRADARIAELVERFGLRSHLDTPSAGPPARAEATALAGGRSVARARHASAGRADFRRGSGRPRRVLGVAHRPLASSGGDDLRLDPFHERGPPLRPHLIDARGHRAGLRHSGPADGRAQHRRPGNRVHRLHRRRRGRPPKAGRQRALRERREGKRREGSVLNRCPDRFSRRDQAHPPRSGLSLGRMLAYSRREAQEIERDPVRLLFAFLGSALMMLAFGFGITTDVENIRFAYLDLDQSPESRAYLSAFEGSRYFIRHAPAQTPDELQLRLKSHEIEVALEVQPNFGRNVRKANVGEVIAWVDGAADKPRRERTPERNRRA